MPKKEEEEAAAAAADSAPQVILPRQVVHPVRLYMLRVQLVLQRPPVRPVLPGNGVLLVVRVFPV
jgi:hypothetical protein